jgi:hypothetical protein
VWKNEKFGMHLSLSLSFGKFVYFLSRTGDVVSVWDYKGNSHLRRNFRACEFVENFT